LDGVTRWAVTEAPEPNTPVLKEPTSVGSSLLCGGMAQCLVRDQFTARHDGPGRRTCRLARDSHVRTIMGRSTFSGPMAVGTNNDESADRNVGLVVLSQTYDSGDLTGSIQGNYDVRLGTLPAGAQIVDIVIDQVVAAAAGTTTVSLGTASGGAQLSAAVATTAGGRFRGTATAATQLAWQVSAASDQAIWLRNAVGTATLTAGRFVATVLYIQK
jgi:hypothetical protein